MLFLIEYDRPNGKLVRLETFDDANHKTAEDSRLNLELDLNRRHIEHEVVLLKARNETALRRTHGRYFEEWAEMDVELLRGGSVEPEGAERR